MPKNSKTNAVAYHEHSVVCVFGYTRKIDRNCDEKRVLARHARFCTKVRQDPQEKQVRVETNKISDNELCITYTTPKRHYLKLP
jgi:hypothetical protein